MGGGGTGGGGGGTIGSANENETTLTTFGGGEVGENSNGVFSLIDLSSLILVQVDRKVLESLHHCKIAVLNKIVIRRPTIGKITQTCRGGARHDPTSG